MQGIFYVCLSALFMERKEYGESILLGESQETDGSWSQ